MPCVLNNREDRNPLLSPDGAVHPAVARQWGNEEKSCPSRVPTQSIYLIYISNPIMPNPLMPIPSNPCLVGESPWGCPLPHRYKRINLKHTTIDAWSLMTCLDKIWVWWQRLIALRKIRIIFDAPSQFQVAIKISCSFLCVLRCNVALSVKGEHEISQKGILSFSSNSKTKLKEHIWFWCHY